MSDFIFGVCIDYKNREKLLTAKSIGAEFFEFGYSSLSNADNVEIDDLSGFLKSEGIPCPTANGMFPAELMLVGPDVDYARIDEYLSLSAEKFSKLGGKTVVFGSGRARRCPDEWSYDKATEQLVELCANHIAPCFRKYSLQCAIEPLRHEECNVITTAKRGYEICTLANAPEIGLLIDLYHFDIEKEPRESITDYSDKLMHIHIASATNERKYPKPNDGTDYQNFFNMLRKVGYSSKLISLEGRCDDFEAEAKTAFELLKTM